MRQSEKKARVARVHRRIHPAVFFALAIIFLLACMIASLFMRTTMVQNSFTISKLNNQIAMLNQDVQDRQDKLEQLDSQLPDRAQKLGMKTTESPGSIDITHPVDPNQVRQAAGTPKSAQQNSQQQNSQKKQ
jgi:cell division protein FtsL